MQKYIPFVSRILLAVIFLWAGIAKVTQFAMIQENLAGIGLPMASFIVAVAVILEIGGGLLVLVGYQTRWASIALISLVVVSTLVFHLQISIQAHQIMFMRNMALIGALLSIISCGPGPLSLAEKTQQA